MNNSRIKPIEGTDLNMEAIAATIVIDYDPVNPEKSMIRFAFKDFLTKGDGAPLGFSDGKFDLIPCELSSLMDIDTGVPGVSMGQLIEAVKGVSNSVHNARAARDAEGAANGQ